MTNERGWTVVAGLIGFLLMAAYWPWIAGIATTPRWDVGVLIALALFFAPDVRMTPAHWCGLALIAWLMLSLNWSESRHGEGTDAAFKLCAVAAAFALGATLPHVRSLIIGAAVGVQLSSIIAIAQWCGFTRIPSFGYPAGLFFNGDRLAEVAALVALACVALRLWWLLPGLVPALTLPHARGALLALMVGLGYLAGRSAREVKTIFRVGAVTASFAIVLGVVGGVRGIDGGITERIALWHDTVSDLSIWGHGLGSFWARFPAHASWFDLKISRPEHPHNEWLWLGYEGGVVAVVLCAVLSAVLWRSSAAPLRVVLLALLVESLFAMPFHDPATILFAALCTGWLARDPDAVRGTAEPCRDQVSARLGADAYRSKHGRSQSRAGPLSVS